jgi:tetratricopeptide (TPR) repeat protein
MPAMRCFRVIAAASLAVGLSVPAAAQTGRAVGSVTDTAGKAIKGATIQASNREAYPSQVTSTTDDKGRFGMIGMRAGVWQFTAAAPGYESTEVSVPIRSATAGPPMRFVLQRSPEPIPGALAKDIDTELSAAAAMRDQGRIDQALVMFQEIQNKNAKLSTLNLVIGDLYRQKAERETDGTARQALYERAITAYNDVLKTDADNDRAKIEFALTSQLAGHRDVALKALQDVITANPGSLAAEEATSHLDRLKQSN